jgi:site-specific DNA-cytosine methylase
MKALAMYTFAGGFNIGVAEAGFEIVAQLESKPGHFASTIRANWDHPVLEGPDEWAWPDEHGRPDLMFCNPPCAIWSSLGANHSASRDWASDERLSCHDAIMTVFEQVRPRVLMWESVTGAFKNGRELCDLFADTAVGMGYNVTHVLHDAAGCGSLQKRRRYMFVAHEMPIDWWPSIPPEKRLLLRDVKDALRQAYETLPAVYEPPAMTRGDERFLRMLEQTPAGQPVRTWYAENYGTPAPAFNIKRLSWDKPANTYVGAPVVHPDEPRFLSEGECRFIADFPMDYVLPTDGARSTHTELDRKGRQMAQGVSPVVAEWFAGSIADSLENEQHGPPVVTILDDLHERVIEAVG